MIQAIWDGMLGIGGDAAIIQEGAVARLALGDWLKERALGLQDLLTPELKRKARKDAGTAWVNAPVKLNPRIYDDRAYMVGEYPHHINQATGEMFAIGEESALAKERGVKLQYVPSTRRVEVGYAWILNSVVRKDDHAA